LIPIPPVFIKGLPEDVNDLGFPTGILPFPAPKKPRIGKIEIDIPRGFAENMARCPSGGSSSTSAGTTSADAWKTTIIGRLTARWRR
jgi:hypothetical protein